MRRRPMEVWWISVFGLFQALVSFHTYHDFAGPQWEQALLAGYGIAFATSAGMLVRFSDAGRLATLVLLGIEGVQQSWLLATGWQQPFSHLALHLSFAIFCVWMFCYLLNPSTERLFKGSLASPVAGLDMHVLDFVEVGLCFAAAGIAYVAGADLWLSASAGMTFCICYGLLLEDWVRSRWAAWFAPVEPGFPAEDAAMWRAACRALLRNDPRNAREHFSGVSWAGRIHPAGRMVLRLCDWMELLRRVPGEGRDCLRRAALDHDWKPGHAERNRLTDYVDCANLDEVCSIVEARTELIDSLVAAGLDSRSFFQKMAADQLSRITGETFQFNAPESWAAWWQKNREHWSGDAGLVALTTRLMRMDADMAAHGLSKKVAGRAEEPLLKELTAQVLFLNRMQKAIREHHGGLDTFIKQPARMLLVPELTDAVGLLHADSQLLENLGMGLDKVARRLGLRVQLVDYIGSIWQRYPGELGADMPWVVKTLTDKNLGVLRARARFTAWWPGARDSFLRHDAAVAEGLAAYAAQDYERSEKAFRAALVEQPRELSSRYNLSLCLMRRQAYSEAAGLLEELTRLEPKESYWWLALGEMHRNINRTSEAHAAFRKALELGAAAPRVAWHRGLTFARDHRDADAIKQLDRVLGSNPTASKIDALASALESEGLWKLAGHYREEAFRKGLTHGDDGDEQNAEDVSA
ncbi:MAG TPA: tetratricopeptide repeat protein [Planctomycetota bacterium]|nr:tetratricopeptide repeat protein [Planctomycetota bacterium]